jgi:sarcosine oxidase subunit beta
MKTDVAIIGAGINGCAIAYELAKRGMDVAVFEKKWIASGDTGRCGAGIRQQWATEENAILAKKSVEIFEKLGEELNYDIGLRQGGYLVVIHSEEEMKQAKKNVEMQNRLGIPSRIIYEDEIKEIAPVLDLDGMEAIAATFCHTDGHANPFKTTYAYALAAKKLGAKIYKFTEVKGIKVKDNQIEGILTDKGEIKANFVVNAAGAWSGWVARMAGVELPNRPVRKEALVTEPIKRTFDCMVISFKHGIYFSQQEEGQILGGIPSPEEKTGYYFEPTFSFLKHMAFMLGKYAPQLKHIKILRQWTGFYDVTPDALPILGKTSIEGFIQCNGFSGHGFMISPMVAKLISQIICGEKTALPIDNFSIERFKGKIFKEKAVVG